MPSDRLEPSVEHRGSTPIRQVILKIASRCNLNCTYCYVYNRADQSWRTQPAFMSEAVARQTAARIREQCRAHGKRQVVIVLHCACCRRVCGCSSGGYCRFGGVHGWLGK